MEKCPREKCRNNRKGECRLGFVIENGQCSFCVEKDPHVGESKPARDIFESEPINHF